ncbi:MAG: hypothetical protein J6X58_07335 [Bacteroidales bacterium]|nr:hypothetical protein [Bacteroidales bacterium]
MKRNIFIPLTIMLFCVFGCVSCVMYHPHNVDIPLLEQKGDLRIDGSLNMTFPLLDGTGANATVSWAPLNMLGLQASGSISDPENYQVQAAVGTFKGWGKSVLEFYVGAAKGHSYYEFSNKQANVGGPYNMFFGQINFGWNHLANDIVDVGVGFKSGMMNPNWSKETYDESTGTWSIAATHTDPHLLIEPLLMLRMGGEHLKFCINVAYSVFADWPTDDNNFNYTRLSVGAGLNYKF